MKGITNIRTGKVRWTTSAYHEMQQLTDRSPIERAMIRDFAAAVCRREDRNQITGKDVKSAVVEIFGKGEDG